jgi:hypothetical protein
MEIAQRRRRNRRLDVSEIILWLFEFLKVNTSDKLALLFIETVGNNNDWIADVFKMYMGNFEHISEEHNSVNKEYIKAAA